MRYIDSNDYVGLREGECFLLEFFDVLIFRAGHFFYNI